MAKAAREAVARQMAASELSEGSSWMKLVIPSRHYLPSYVEALRRGWTLGDCHPDDELAEIAADPLGVLDIMRDNTRGGRIALPDGSTHARLCGFRRWMWDGEFCGAISFRWQAGTAALPAHCLGHIGFSVVPWKRRLGYATAALGCLLAESHPCDLDYIEIVTENANHPSRRVIESNGGVLVNRFRPTLAPEMDALRYVIALGNQRGSLQCSVRRP